jgi:NAD(P)-dependent dehydrogenase (short-subunit alcohol dehydrogenase family)
MSKAIFITGANRGLGFELAEEATGRGYRVFAGVRSSSAPDGRLAELAGRFPGLVEVVQIDVTSEDTVAAFANRLKESGAKLHVILNSAGILLARGQKLEQLSMEEVAESFEVNVFGPMRVVKHLLPLMIDGPASAIVNISSEAGSIHNAYGGDYPYAMSKTALNMFSKQVRSYVRERGIRVYAVHPGWIRTDMGGGNAPGDPRESAQGILDIAEGRTAVAPEHFFINYKGDPMPI